MFDRPPSQRGVKSSEKPRNIFDVAPRTVHGDWIRVDWTYRKLCYEAAGGDIVQYERLYSEYEYTQVWQIFILSR